MKTAVLLSGGIDSTTALAQAVDTYGAEHVIALSVLYGQKHKKELSCAEKIRSEERRVGKKGGSRGGE